MSATPFRWRWPVATTACGLLRDQVIHDGQIVRSEVPDDVYVVLEQAQVDACRIVVVELTEDTIVDQLTHLDGASEQEGVVHHDLQVLAFRQFDEVFGLSAVQVKGFSTKMCLPFSKAFLARSKWVWTGVTIANGIDICGL